MAGGSLRIPRRFLVLEEEEAVSAGCRPHALWGQELPGLLGGAELHGLQLLPWQWHPAPGLLAPGPPGEEAAEGEAQHRAPCKERRTAVSELQPDNASTRQINSVTVC